MIEKKLHRVPIVEKDGKLANLISQSSVVDFLFKNKFVWEKDLGALTMTEANLHNITAKSELFSVQSDKTALAAFTLLHEKRVSGLPVVDEHNKLVANISVQDLKVRNLFLVFSWLLITVVLGNWCGCHRVQSDPRASYRVFEARASAQEVPLLLL